jgi:hypothetical protein
MGSRVQTFQILDKKYTFSKKFKKLRSKIQNFELLNGIVLHENIRRSKILNL